MSESKSNKAVNIFALIGFFLLLAIAIWSTVQVVKFVPRMFAPTEEVAQTESTQTPPTPAESASPSLWSRITDLFFTRKTKLALEPLPQEVKSGTPLTVRWELKAAKDGVLSFSYKCEPGFHFRLPALSHATSNQDVQVDTKNYTVLPCNMPYTLPQSQKELILIPVVDGGEQKEAAFALAFTEASGKTVRAIAKLLVTPPASAQNQEETTTETDTSENPNLFPREQSSNTQATTNTSSKTQTPTKKPVRYITVPVRPVSDPNGTPNLLVRILSVGVIDPRTGAFVPKGTIAPYERAAVRFEVTNTGTKETGPWNYRADLPTRPTYYYASKWQPSLLPGAKATVTVAFDQLQLGRVAVRVYVDPYNYIRELHENDNTDQRYFTVVNYQQY